MYTIISTQGPGATGVQWISTCSSSTYAGMNFILRILCSNGATYDTWLVMCFVVESKWPEKCGVEL